MVHPNKVRSSAMQQPIKRRAVQLCDDDNDELPKTPIHGGITHKVSVTPRVLDSKKKNVGRGESNANNKLVLENSGMVDDALKEQVQASGASNKASSPTSQLCMDKRTRESSAEQVSPSQLQLGSVKLRVMEAQPVIVSPKRSPQSVSTTRPLVEPQKKHLSKAPGNISQKKVPSGGNRALATASDRSTSSKPTSSGEKSKTTPKSDSQINGSALVVGNPDESISELSERLDMGKDTKTSFPVDPKISDTGVSMKHLIAAAQARKRQAHLQNSHGNPLALLISDADMLGRSPSSTPATIAVQSSNTLQQDVQVLHPSSPSSDVRQFSSINEHENEDLPDRRASSGHQAAGSSLSGGTEAAVARDAFEGMVETLSRTKESIGRATRLAIDCAKYGIASEVVELLIHKLENEPSYHRKVDLFFLVDSITQCSHSQKGVAGASYIPTVQAALPRLIGAAAPPGTGAQENRRQCRKVLRLWLERKIFPESLLHHYIDDIGAINDDTSGFSIRRPSRAERSFDDPIREMEGMLVDEYGSNATFQLPGFLPSHLFEEEEEDDEDNFPTKLCKEAEHTSVTEHATASRDPDNHTVTPSDRHHHILEDVDGELEMEDVSGHQKDERLLFANGASEVASLVSKSDEIFESASNISELLPSPEGSPPLPSGSPPVTPPLPTSPPPPLSSPSPPLLPPPPPPPAEPPSSQQHLVPPPPVGPPPHVGPPPFVAQQSLPPPPQSALMSQHMPPLPSTSTSQPLAYRPPLPHEIGGALTGNQHTQMVSSSHGSHMDAPVRGEEFSQQSSLYPPVVVSNVREHGGYNSSSLVECGHGNAYMNPQQRQPFLPGSAHFAQRPLRPEPQPHQTSSHLSYPNSVQQHQQPPYSLPSLSDGPSKYAIDGQWRMQVNELNADCPRGVWMTGWRSCSGPPYSHEAGYFGPPHERPPPGQGAINFQPSAANIQPAAQISVRGVAMMPGQGRPPEMSAVNWRPV
ncbi:hypothetical protein CDL12_09064 [Handroanthus impetiginosus]|uniref:CID domain-containing protein n=1 Tax=Handroanthus impetiginosus TaxID=429701 RepID=A0A2G9HL54_9LAMI|nr:hypothetical protein CDL12_09064 [Handroanthus impetiginosus]